MRTVCIFTALERRILSLLISPSATDDDEPGPAVKHEPDEGGAALPKYESEEGEEMMEIAARLSASHWIDAANIISPPVSVLALVYRRW